MRRKKQHDGHDSHLPFRRRDSARAYGSMDRILEKAAKGRISHSDMPALAGLLRSGLRLPRLIALCVLSDIEWGDVPMSAREEVFRALCETKDASCSEARRCATILMGRIADSRCGGGLDEEKTAC